MNVKYVCKHCRQPVGEVSYRNWSTADAEMRLGISALSPAERLESVHYPSSGEMQVQTVCESCQQALETNPQLLVEGKLLQ